MSSLSVGIVGLPNVGKSTLFNALAQRRQADVSNYPFTTVEPNIAIVEVPDKRLVRISRLSGISKRVPATVKFVDIAGLVKNAHLGEGLGNEFLGHIREVSVIVHLVRRFENSEVAHIEGSIDPKRDFEIVKMELILKDLDTVERKLAEKKNDFPEDLLKKVADFLNSGETLNECNLNDSEMEALYGLHLLTRKPVLYVLNISENQISTDTKYRKKTVEIDGYKAVEVCAKLEADLAEVDVEERKEYLSQLGIKGSALDHIILLCYNLLDLITFFTIAKGTQVQAWPVPRGMTSYEAAGEVHSDFMMGFIKAEIVSFADFENTHSWTAAQKAGKVKLVGRDYIMKDGDIIEFKART